MLATGQVLLGLALKLPRTWRVSEDVILPTGEDEQT